MILQKRKQHQYTSFKGHLRKINPDGQPWGYYTQTKDVQHIHPRSKRP